MMSIAGRGECRESVLCRSRGSLSTEGVVKRKALRTTTRDLLNSRGRCASSGSSRAHSEGIIKGEWSRRIWLGWCGCGCCGATSRLRKKNCVKPLSLGGLARNRRERRGSSGSRDRWECRRRSRCRGGSLMRSSIRSACCFRSSEVEVVFKSRVKSELRNVRKLRCARASR